MKGRDGFDAFYRAIYRDRWDALKSALDAPAQSTPITVADGPEYYLDPASIVAALCLEVAPGDRVLDLCAAPGGKSLVMASRIGEGGSLTSNERSATRRARLHRVLAEHLPAELLERITVTSHDASRWALYEPAAYDRVLADVPCSSERHVLHAPAELAKWSATRTKRLATGAYAIACAAADALRPGGRMVYSTCTISPIENDGVIVRLLARPKGARVACVDLPSVLRRAGTGAGSGAVAGAAGTPTAHGEPTEHGWMILPDSCAGAGPMYIAVLERRA